MKTLIRSAYVVGVAFFTWCVGIVCCVMHFGLPRLRISKDRYTGTEIEYQALVAEILIVTLLIFVLSERRAPRLWTKLTYVAAGVAILCSSPLMLMRYYDDFFK